VFLAQNNVPDFLTPLFVFPTFVFPLPVASFNSRAVQELVKGNSVHPTEIGQLDDVDPALARLALGDKRGVRSKFVRYIRLQ
jgi:hypothetical protein